MCLPSMRGLGLSGFVRFGELQLFACRVCGVCPSLPSLRALRPRWLAPDAQNIFATLDS